MTPLLIIILIALTVVNILVTIKNKEKFNQQLKNKPNFKREGQRIWLEDDQENQFGETIIKRK